MDTIYKWLRAMPLRRGPRRLVGGVCGGIAYKTGWDVGMVRLITLIALILPIISLPAYLIAWVIIPWGASDEAAEKATRRGSTAAIPPREDDPLLLEKFMTWGSDKLRN
ncbi:PspC domain-containing protein [Pseudoglutamicibacter cumminsii]|uniref:PspC domain-containing protein n=1 Tax=Pseudoglutamicibacter cumminsii TaxID=156979 RepID=UPI00195CD141|nr:PspC domain-containing protein [Pseudoglutamicibacter cumminsii]MBM7795438.1 phage shock protein PspC (stress-responsive transcriptional regulator) [Pseudoglutamicibacter cumminsii]